MCALLQPNRNNVEYMYIDIRTRYTDTQCRKNKSFDIYLLVAYLYVMWQSLSSQITMKYKSNGQLSRHTTPSIYKLRIEYTQVSERIHYTHQCVQCFDCDIIINGGLHWETKYHSDLGKQRKYILVRSYETWMQKNAVAVHYVPNTCAMHSIETKWRHTCTLAVEMPRKRHDLRWICRRDVHEYVGILYTFTCIDDVRS